MMINKDHEYYYSDTRLDKPHLTHTLDWFCSNSSGSLIAAWFKTHYTLNLYTMSQSLIDSTYFNLLFLKDECQSQVKHAF